MQPEINVFPTRHALASALANQIADTACLAMAARGQFVVALSGGSLIDIISPPLISNAMRAAIDWSGWRVFWADERWVAKSDPESNYGLAQKRLLSHVPIPANCVHMADNVDDPEQTAADYAAAISQALPPGPTGWPAFDLILLGIGPDGHTASLFPGHSALAETRRRVAPIYDSPKPPPVRITLTLPVINSARQVIFVVAGSEKASIMAKILAPAAGCPPLPAQLVQPAQGRLLWYIDQGAARHLQPLPMP